MTLDTVIIFAGAFVAILPFLGFPSSWDTVLLFLVGTLIVALGVVIRRGRGEGSQTPAKRSRDTFVENLPDRQVGEPM